MNRIVTAKQLAEEKGQGCITCGVCNKCFGARKDIRTTDNLMIECPSEIYEDRCSNGKSVNKLYYCPETNRKHIHYSDTDTTVVVPDSLVFDVYHDNSRVYTYKAQSIQAVANFMLTLTGVVDVEGGEQ